MSIKSSVKIPWINQESCDVLYRGYLQANTTPEERLEEILDVAFDRYKIGTPEEKEEFWQYVVEGLYSFSSPVWANYGCERGLPISCFGSYVSDSMESILYKAAEVGIMTKHGGGTSGYFGAIRARGSPISDGGKTNGVVHFLNLYDSVSSIVSQSSVRRGAFAAYLPIEHGDVEEFLTIRDEDSSLQQMHFGVTINKAFRDKVKRGDSRAVRFWKLVIDSRFRKGYPYIVDTDNAMAGAPEVYRDKNLQIHGSNLCTEVMLPQSEIESFVCCLMSMNARKWDLIKKYGYRPIHLAVRLLNSVLDEFIIKASKIRGMEPAVTFAKRHRAIGLGVLGYHDYLQINSIPFASLEAKAINREIFSCLKKEAYAESERLAKIHGEPEVMKGYGRYNSTLIAIAPTVSSSFIMGQSSQGIEPRFNNYYVDDIAKISCSIKNPILMEILVGYGKNTDEVWNSIRDHSGSVQHLTFLTPHEKEVFLTFSEISQYEVILQACQRQEWIDQGQSVNLRIPNETSMKDMNFLLMYAFDNGLKSLYYHRGFSPVHETIKSIRNCANCEA